MNEVVDRQPIIYQRLCCSQKVFTYFVDKLRRDISLVCL
jgi:hypothetical protein